MKALLVVVVLLAVASVAEAAPETAEWYPVAGASGYEIEMQTGTGAFAAVVTGITPTACTATLCSATITPPNGIARWRVVTLFGTLRVPTLDSGFYTCLGVAECPLPARGARVR